MFTRRETFRKSAALIVTTLARGQSQEAQRVSVPFQHAAGRGSMLVRVRVNRKPATLILDTGASHTIVRPALLGINPADLSRPGARAGVIGDAIGREVTLEVGDQAWPRRRVSVIDLTQVLSAYSERIDGLLGLDFFLEFSQAIINLKGRVVTFIR
jgi:hypothetical protein